MYVENTFITEVESPKAVSKVSVGINARRLIVEERAPLTLEFRLAGFSSNVFCQKLT